ncbi:MAG: hypothetical protein WC734_05910 [Patescibacteria group bacterium]|jgi:hypothetical protein
MAMSNQEKLELVITARNLTQAEFDKLANSLKATTTQANAAQASMGKFAKVREPLMRLASGPLQQLMGSFGAFIRLAATLPKAVLGPIGLLIGLIMALESKFNIIAKTIATVKVAFEALASFNFSGLGKSISDIWTGAKEKAEAAKEAAKGYNDALVDLLEAQGHIYEAAYEKEKARHQKKLDEIAANEKIGLRGRSELLELERQLHNQNNANITAELNKALTDRQNIRRQALAKQIREENEMLVSAANDVDKFVADRDEKDRQRNVAKLDELSKILTESEAISQRFWDGIDNQIGGVVDSVSSTFGAAFEQMVNTSKTAGEAMIEAFNQFGRQVLFMIGKMIAKFLFLNLLKAIFSGATGGLGGAIAGFAEKSLGNMSASMDNLFPSKQADTGATSRVPGAFGMPVPIIAHGGEIIGRPEGGGGPSIVIQGDVYGWDETIERIRSGLYTHSRRTGMSAVPA